MLLKKNYDYIYYSPLNLTYLEVIWQLFIIILKLQCEISLL